VGSDIFMRYRGAIQSTGLCARLFFSALLLVAWIPSCFAQEPPLEVPINRLPAKDPNAIAVGGWLLYPTVRVYSLLSDNYFLSPVTPISGPAFGVTPSLAAEWSNGIHSTSLYGNLDRQQYPTHNEVNTLDGRAGFTQKYEAMRDLIFRVNGDYSHQTLSSSLQSSIQTAAVAPTTIVLPNGNTQLPNGTILSPTGQIVGQANPAFGSNIPLLVNPYDRFTGTVSVDKIFNRGIVSLSGSLNRTEYENQQNLSSQNTRSRTFTENAAFWLGPLFYAYSSGSIGTVVTEATSASTTSYRVVGGLGTRQYGLFRGSVYFGHQGSQFGAPAGSLQGSNTAGGDVYGAAITYYPTPLWTLTGTVDRTSNVSSQTAVTNLALTLPGLNAVQIPLGTSTEITSAALRSDYQINPLWSTTAQLGYTRIEYTGTPRLDNAWIFNTTLRYDVWRDMSLTWEYRYRSIISNAPFVSATSNYGMMGATYRF
jgi:putative beta-barrel porin BBP2